MSSYNLFEHLDISENYYGLANTFVGEVKKLIANPPTNATVHDGNGYVRNIQGAIDADIVPASLTHFFNEAVRLHNEIYAAHEKEFVTIDLDPHHYNFDDKGNLRTPPYMIEGLPELSAAALLYNPILPLPANPTPRDIRAFNDRREIIFDVERTQDKIDMLAQLGGWNADLMKNYLFIRSVANCANRLVGGTPKGQFDAKHWEDYILNVAAPIAGVSVPEVK